MTDTTHPHPLDAAIEAIKPLAECEIEEYAPFAQDSDIVRFPFTIAEVRAARSALPAITAYREGMGKPTPPAPTREDAIRKLTKANRDDVDVSNCISSRGLCKPKHHDGCICRHIAETNYDALLAMGAIREPRTITGSPEGWGKRVEVTVLGDREEGSGIDQMNQIAGRMAMKPRAD
jgi:hypothetical protein